MRKLPRGKIILNSFFLLILFIFLAGFYDISIAGSRTTIGGILDNTNTSTTNGYASASNSADLNINGASADITLEGWVMVKTAPSSFPTYQAIIEKQGGYGLYIRWNDSDAVQIVFRIYTDSTNNDEAYSTPLVSEINADTWYHIAAVFDTDGDLGNGKVDFFLDGVQLFGFCAGCGVITDNLISSTSDLTIGNSGSLKFYGFLDEIRISNSTQYTTDFTPVDTLSDVVTGTVALYHFNTPTPLSDTITASTNTIADDLSLIIPATTRVKISSFRAKKRKGNVILKWKSEGETDIEGFNLWRVGKKRVNYLKLNDELISVKNKNAFSGAGYRFLDKNVKRGKIYFYKLEAVDTKGGSTFNKPEKVKIKKNN